MLLGYSLHERLHRKLQWLRLARSKHFFSQAQPLSQQVTMTQHFLQTSTLVGPRTSAREILAGHKQLVEG